MEGGYDAGDGDTKLASVTFGAQFADGRGSSVFNIRTDEQGGVMARDRTPYTGRDIFHYGIYAPNFGDFYKDYVLDPGYSSYPPQGRFFVSGNNADSSGMKTFDCSERDFDSVVKSDTVVDWGGSAACGFNRTYYRALEVPLERYSVFNSSKYEFDNGTTMFSEISFTSVDSQSTFEPVPFSSEDAFGGLGTKGYNIRNPYMPAAIRDAALAAQGVLDANGAYTVGTDSSGNAVAGMYLNAAGNEIEVPFIRRLAEFGTRGASNTRQTFRASMGLEGTLSNGMDWDAHYSYGFSDRIQYSGAYNAANGLRCKCSYGC
jgi:hypothetical protein